MMRGQPPPQIFFPRTAPSEAVKLCVRLFSRAFCRYNVSATAAKPYVSIVHAVWTTSEIPRRWKVNAWTWRTQNADFAYCLWTHAELAAFVAAEYPWLLPTYSRYPYPIQRCDAARYMLLYRYGGVYVDLDVMCRTPLSSVFQETPAGVGVVLTPALPLGIATDFIAVRRPRDPVIRGVLSGLRRAAASWWYPPRLPYTSVMFRTGPVYFTRRINCHDRLDQILVVTASKNRKYLHYVGGASWHGWDGWIRFKFQMWHRALISSPRRLRPPDASVSHPR